MSKSESFPKTLILGGTGFIGSELKNLYQDSKEDFMFSSSQEVDILDADSLRNFIKNNEIDVVVNLAAYTDVNGANSEKGDKNGQAWKLNVDGAVNVANVCKDESIFLIHISTDNVFYGGSGPFSEDQKPVNDGEVDWYGYTKRMAEEEIEKVGGELAIIRIAYPFGGVNPDKDYILKLIKNIGLERPIFADQNFTPTYIPTLAKVLKKIVSGKISGKFHVVCKDVTTPFEIAEFLVEKLSLPHSAKKGSISEYEKMIDKKSPYNANGGLIVEATENILNETLPSWREAVKEFTDKIPQG